MADVSGNRGAPERIARFVRGHSREEVTCAPAGTQLHLLALGSEKFIPGSGDSGERGLSRAAERSIGEARSNAANGGGCVARPIRSNTYPCRTHFPGKRSWRREDLETTGVTALQIHNGGPRLGIRMGMAAWIKLLLAGRRISAFGGSDSHGDMNRRRSIGIPFLSVGNPPSCARRGKDAVRAQSGSWRDILDGSRRAARS